MDPTMVLAQVSTLSTAEQILQLTVQGLALGAIYAMIALGFVVIFKATDVINFAHGALMLVGTYMTLSLVSGQYPWLWHWRWGVVPVPAVSDFGRLVDFPSWLGWWVDLPIKARFPLGIVIAMVIVAGLGLLVERTVLRKLVGQPVFAVVLITLGLELVLSTSVQIFWGPSQRVMPSPFPPTSVLRVGDVALSWGNIWTIIILFVVVAGFFAFFRLSRHGLAMRATAFDQEAAMSMGIKASNVFALAWGIGGALAALAGALFVPTRLSGFITLAPVRFAALNAFPAAILGGLDSPGGAVVGGLTIGVAQVLSSRWLNPIFLDWNFPNFHLVFPYIIMIVILLIRPYGLFGTREVRRV